MKKPMEVNKMEDKKLNDAELEQVIGGVNAEDHNVMLTGVLPKDIDPDIETGDLEKAKDGRIL